MPPVATHKLDGEAVAARAREEEGSQVRVELPQLAAIGALRLLP